MSGAYSNPDEILIPVMLTVEAVRLLIMVAADAEYRGNWQPIAAACRAALPAPIVWETHLGVEMARVGDRVAVQVDYRAGIYPYNCVCSKGRVFDQWRTVAEAEEWLRDGAK